MSEQGPQDGWMTIKDVARTVRLGESEIYEQVREKRFPQPVKLSPRCSRFVRAEVAAWMQQRVKERDAALAARG